MKAYFLLGWCWLVLSLSACEAPLRQAEELLQNQNYSKAEKILQTLAEDPEAPPETKTLLAQASFYTQGPLEALEQLQQLQASHQDEPTYRRVIKSLSTEFAQLDQLAASGQAAEIEAYLEKAPHEWFKQRAQWLLYLKSESKNNSLREQLQESADPVIQQLARWEVARTQPEQFQELIQSFNKSSLKPAWYQALIDNYWQNDKKAEAQNALVKWKEELPEKHPVKARVLLRQAEYSQPDKPVTSLNYYRTYLQLFPEHPDGRKVIYKIREELKDHLKTSDHRFLAQAAADRYMYQTAYAELSQVPARDADDHLKLADYAVKAKLTAQARQHYLTLSQNYKGQRQAGLASVGLASLQRQAKAYGPALQQLESVLSAYGSIPEVVAAAWWEKSQVYDMQSQDEFRALACRKAVEADPSYAEAMSALWYAIWYAFQQHNYAEVIDPLEKHRKYYAKHTLKSRFEYWLARAYEETERREEALNIYNELAKQPLMDYYSHRARERLRVMQRGGDDQFATQPFKGLSREKLPQISYQQAFQQALKGENQAFSELMELYYLGQYEPFMQLAEDDPDPLIQTLHGMLMHRQGRYYEAVTRYRYLAEKDDRYLPAAFPLAFFETIEPEAKKQGLNPFLVSGLIWQESQYNPTIQSWVGATGLMQIMPATGQQIAQSLALPQNYSLKDAATNIRMGTWYLKSRHDVFDGNPMFAVASYNAGAGPAMRWKDTFKQLPYDAQAESITYPETRGYVKRVFTSYWIYQHLYGL